MIKGSTFVLKLTIYTGNDAKVIWSTSDPEIATVDNNGKVTAIGYGSAVITVSTEDNSLTAICNVKVSTINTNNDIRPSQGFSPDGDGENDYWIIDGIEKHLKNDLYIFDRGGKLHYSVKNYKNDWDGIANTGPYKGRKVPPGTYYYVLKIDDVQMKRSFIVIKY